MIYVKPTTVGIDVSIQSFQVFTYAQLKKIWGFTDDTKYDSFGRVYRNQTEDGYVPESYDGSAEYHDVLINDQVLATSFFGVAEQSGYNAGSATAKVHWIFGVNLGLIKPGTARLDEEIRNDVQKVSTMRRAQFKLTGFETGVDQVFKEYSGWKIKQGIKFRDMHPWHIFRLNFDIVYSIYDNSNCST